MDAILYWNEVALEANRESHTNGKKEQTGPPLSARALAVVHLAMYDAFAGASGNPADLPAYLPGLAVPVAASPDAAVASAAHATLSALFPSQKPRFDVSLALAELTGTAAEVNAGVAFGKTVAGAILADRAADPGIGDAGYAPSSAPARHRVDPDNPGQPIHAPFYGAQAKCFAVTARHGLGKPPLPGDAEYDEALEQVRGKGIAPELSGTVPAASRRTTDETAIGVFWAYDGVMRLGTPPRLYNQIVRKIAQAQGNSVAENARLFALVNTAMADAGILAWEQKFVHDLWRPVLGIRENDPCMGPEGTPAPNVSPTTDTGWLPLGAPATNDPASKNFTPPFPAYPSGHATFGAAAFQVTRLFYGVTANGSDTLADGLYFVSDELNGVNTDNNGTVRPRHVRSFPDGLWGMIQENSISRVFLGVHWIFDGYLPTPAGTMDLSENVGGVRLGIDIAEDIFNGARAAGLVKSTV
jgi:hypothetical protein